MNHIIDFFKVILLNVIKCVMLTIHAIQEKEKKEMQLYSSSCCFGKHICY